MARWSVPRSNERGLSAAALLALLVAFACLGPGAVLAEEGGDPLATAAARHQRGLDLFEAGDYAAAQQEFEAAQALAPSPANLFNIARCREQLGDLPGALSSLEQFLAVPDLPPDHRARGEADLERLRAAVSAGPAGGETPPGEGEGGPGVGEGGPGEGGPGEGGPAEAPAPRFTWTGALQVGGGAAFTLNGDVAAGALLDLELAVGLQFGRLHRGPRLDVWPLRFELVASVFGELGMASPMFEATGSGRLSLSLGRLPVRLEGEAGLGVALFFVGDVTEPDLMVQISVAVVYQIRRWLEVSLRPARLELLGLTGNYPTPVGVRYGLDLQVRFRI